VSASLKRLRALAAGWRLRAISLQETGMMVAPPMLKECAEELDAALDGREPKRTSWYRHESDDETGKYRAARLRTLALLRGMSSDSAAERREINGCIASIEAELLDTATEPRTLGSERQR
jgi:hypothetical protein